MFRPKQDLISSWTTQGENLIWKSKFIGRSTPVVINGRVYVIGRTGSDEKAAGPLMQEHVACFDAGTGKLIWENKYHVYHSTVPYNRVGWSSLAGDPETGNVYAHGVGGMMTAFNKDGKILWQHPLTEDFGHVSGFGGRTDTPVVDGDLVIQGFVSVEWGDYRRLVIDIMHLIKMTERLCGYLPQAALYTTLIFIPRR